MCLQEFVSVNISLMPLQITVYQMEGWSVLTEFNFALGLCFSKFCLWPQNPFGDKIFLQNVQTANLFRTPFSVIILHVNMWD